MLGERKAYSRVLAIVFLFAVNDVCLAAGYSGYERFLIPITVAGIHGGYGSLWTTELWFRNNSDVPVAVFPLAVSDKRPTAKRTVFLEVFAMPASAPGQFLYLDPAAGPDAQFDLRLMNRADSANHYGTRLPVARSEDFGDVVELINVPTSAAQRCALRVYCLPNDMGPETVRIEMYSEAEELLASAVLPIDVADPMTPGYAAVLSLADEFPAIRTSNRVRVEVTSGSGRTKLWAFITSVSNATQSVSVITQH